MARRTYTPSTVIRNRSRLWRVDAQEGNILIATPIDGGEAEQTKFYVPFEEIQPGQLEPPSSDIVGHISQRQKRYFTASSADKRTDCGCHYGT